MLFNPIKKSLLFLLISFSTVLGWSQYNKTEVEVSTEPVGNSFYRHLADDYDTDIKKLVRYQKRGFGRAEILTMLLLSKITGTELKDYGKRRLDKNATLKEITEEAGLDYVSMYKIVQVIKKDIEARGDKNLPCPEFEEQPKEPEPKKKKKKKPKKKDKDKDIQ